MSKRTAVYQGTFDPFTNGHLSVVRAALGAFDELVILLLVNPVKTPLFSVEERKEMIRRVLADFPNVRVEAYKGLLADYMRLHGLTYCVRGIRNAADAAYELENHALSRVFYPSLQTLLLPSDPQWQTLSSSAVKAACACGRVPSAWVSPSVQQKLKEKYSDLVFFE